MNINVLQIADYTAPYRGNFIASLEALNNLLKKYECNMIWLFPEATKNEKWISDLYDKGYIVYYYSNNIIKNIKLIRDIVKKHSINIFHINFRNFKISFPVALAHITFKKTYLFTHIYSQYTNSTFFKEHFRRLARWDTFYIGCSEPVSNQLIKSGINPKRIFFVENAIDFSRLDDYEMLTNSMFGLEQDRKKILMFGYNWYIKGVDLALAAVKKLIDEKRKIVLLISVASHREIIENYILSKFGEIPNWVKILKPRNDIATYYKFTDVFISPSRMEGLPYALIEAAYCKVPIVASNIPAQKCLKFIGDIWFQTENIESLKNGIERVLYTKDTKLLDIQKKIAVENYQLKKWTKGIIEAYQKVSKFNLKNI